MIAAPCCAVNSGDLRLSGAAVSGRFKAPSDTFIAPLLHETGKFSGVFYARP